jgi:hypothetical protein
VMTGSPDSPDLSRYEPVPSPMAHGPYDDIGMEARRLSRLVRAGRDRDAISARRADGWRGIDEVLAEADAREDLMLRGGGYPDYAARAAPYREAAEVARVAMLKRGMGQPDREAS